jgi:rhodanese-related sulfurtransferase
MSFKKWGTWASLSFLAGLALTAVATYNVAALALVEVAQSNTSQTEFITAEELKAKIASNQPVTIIDVRSVSGLGNDERKIKGSIHVKLRRLRSRLGFAPLKDAPRDREVVTYCACPSDEAGIQAAQVLREAGFKRVRVLKGGWVAWQKVNGQVESAARGL